MEDDPPYDIAVTKTDGAAPDTPVMEALLRSAVEAALHRHRIRTASISIALVNDAQIADLNGQYLHHPGPTDVLTFDLRDDGQAGRSDRIEAAVEGEIVISVETAKRQADELGHGAAAELALYAVHGTLHLLGYEDEEAAQADRMHAVEDEILEALGVGAVYRSGQQ